MDALNYMLNKAQNDGFKTFNDDGYVGVVTMEGKTDEKAVSVYRHHHRRYSDAGRVGRRINTIH